MAIINSLRQLMRTPVKTLFFFVLLTLATAFFLLGSNLRNIADKNIQRLESMFMTVGTVEQKTTSLEIKGLWDAEKKDYIYYKHPVYGEIVPKSVLDFSGAGYIHEPEQRPFYCAYDPGFVVLTDPRREAELEELKLIVEIQPLKDCETGDPVEVRITKVLMGFPTFRGTRVWFCNHSEKSTYKLYADKTYIVSLVLKPAHEGYDSYEEYTPEGISPTVSTENTAVSWDEVTDNFYKTPKGKAWLDLINAKIESIRHTIPVIPTSCTKLLMAFFSGDARIIEGRDINDEEYADGEHVCLIRQDFAKKNEFSVGDSLPLPLIWISYDSSSSVFDTSGENGPLGWPVGNGELTPFDNDTYKIVGIYDVAASNAYTPYALGGNAVIVPTQSVNNAYKNDTASLHPMRGYSTSFQIPNGTIDSFLKAWEAQDIDDIEITFYDGGYSKIKGGLDDMKNMGLLIFTVGAVTTLFTIILFCHLFISKQRRRTAIERSLGLGKARCTLSMLVSVLAIVIPAYIFGSLVSSALTGFAAPRISASHPAQAFDTEYSDWVNSSDNESDSVMISVEVDETGNYLAGATIIPLSLLIALGAISSNLIAEPLKLLGEKER